MIAAQQAGFQACAHGAARLRTETQVWLRLAVMQAMG